MVGLGMDSAKGLAGNANPELTATLEATSQLARSIIWELRQPINMGGIYEGRELGSALRSHATSSANVTSVPAEMTRTGAEPPLSIEAKSPLFSIAHNALTNAYRHAEASNPSTWSSPRRVVACRCRTTVSGCPMITPSGVTASRT